MSIDNTSYCRKLIARLFPVWLLLALLTSPWSVQAKTSNDTLEQQRSLFKQAEKALKFKDNKKFKKLLIELQDYPVIGYLEYDAFRKKLSRVKPDKVTNFLEKYEAYPFSYRLLGKWLNLLAKRKDWKNYLAFYDDRSDVKYKCLSLTARLKTGQTKNINRDIEKIWSTGYSQPDQCDQPFEYYLKTADNISDSIWSRIEKAFKVRRPSLAKYLAKKLDKEDQQLVNEWYQAHRHPAKRLPVLANKKDNQLNRKIIIHALHRLARKDSLKARAQWDKLKNNFEFSAQQSEQIVKRIALSAAYQHKSESKELLQQLPEKLKSDSAHIWLARIHLRDEDWEGLIKTITKMPDHLKTESEWVYWLARAYENGGHRVKSADIFTGLSSRTTYYGFLAADKVDVKYQINQQKAEAESSFTEQQLLDKSDHLLRARELFFLDRLLDARREWFQGIRKLNQQEIKLAASIASNWKWHDNAIKTVAKTSHRSDYDLRFPMPFKKQVMINVKKNDLDPSVIYGVMRRESLFDPLAKSGAGALGLMQLMPSTARGVAKSLGQKKPRKYDILSVNNNIKLGTRYFKTVLKRFDNNVSLAAAAYNAGPGNVRKWLPEKDLLPADLWVETIPFKETRNYVQAVLAYATIFDKQLGKNVQISSRMNDVKPVY
ncbi:MAG: transglycosylase SLT domain-containing protein [Gammaproteobacteria bacterium]|nr:transglycosylase SLT domain-containing protein [Gammaproteobacteria bacterium]